jgi:hypothetical protein
VEFVARNFRVAGFRKLLMKLPTSTNEGSIGVDDFRDVLIAVTYLMLLRAV